MRPSPEFMEALANGAAPAVLLDVDHPDGPGYFWEGVGELKFEGKTYQGAGLLGTITQTRKSAELRIDEIRFTLNALDPEQVSKLSDNVRNRIVVIRLAAMNERQEVVAVYEVDEVSLDYQTDKFDQGMAAVEVVGQSGFWTLERSTDAVYSQEEQALEFPDDTGLSLIPSLRNKDISWNKEPPTVGGG